MNLAFTICSNNYLAKASVVADSYLAHHPGDKFVIVICDLLSDLIDYSTYLNCEYVPVADLVPEVKELALKYNIVELNTAVKPRAFQWLLNKYAEVDQVLYLDPDLMIFSAFDEVYAELSEAETSLVLTPHFGSPIPAHAYPSEVDFQLYGLYNLGFAGLRRSDESAKFLNWWNERLMEYCYIRPERGMFTDQLWVNYAPVFFSGVQLLKHKGYNMASWNLYERKLTSNGGGWLVNDKEPLRFFHFSHFNYDDPVDLGKFGSQFAPAGRPDLKPLLDSYKEQLKAKDHLRLKKIECYYHNRYKEVQSAREKESAKNYFTPKRRIINLVGRVLNTVIPGQKI